LPQHRSIDLIPKQSSNKTFQKLMNHSFPLLIDCMQYALGHNSSGASDAEKGTFVFANMIYKKVVPAT